MTNYLPKFLEGEKVVCYVDIIKTAHLGAILIRENGFQLGEFLCQDRILRFNEYISVWENDGGDTFIPVVYLPYKLSSFVVIRDIDIDEWNLGIHHQFPCPAAIRAPGFAIGDDCFW